MSEPGRVARAGRLLALVAALSAPLGCARLLYNFGEVHPGQIYRSAQPSPLFLRWLVREHGVRSLVNLRGRTPGFESHFAAQHGLRMFTLDLSPTAPPTDAEVERFLAIVRDPQNQPVLVHCLQGIDRTGYMVALYRMHNDGWTHEQARAEMRRFRQFELLNGTPAAVVRDDLRAPEAPTRSER